MADVVDERPPGRGERLAAAGLDAGGGATLLVVLTGTLIVALAYLLARTSWGRLDVGVGDAFVATAIVGASVPAWTVWQLVGVHFRGATFGQRRLGLAVEGRARWRRLLRFAGHPVALPAWSWLALTALLAELPWLPLVPALAIVFVVIAGLVSFVTLLVRPQALPQHDHLAGTRLVRAR